MWRCPLIFKKETVGVVAEYKGAYWGMTYDDGKFRAFGWVTIDKADISDPKYCESPLDMTYRGSPYTEELSKATLRKVTVREEWEIHSE